MKVIVLNLNYMYLNSVPLKKAIKYIINKKAEVIKTTSDYIHNAEKTFVIKVPSVIRLVKMVNVIYKQKVPFSKRNVFTRDKFTCQYCGTISTKMTIDHVIPVSKGGQSTWENCVTACKKCNNKKDCKSLKDVDMKLKSKLYQPTIIEFLVSKMKQLGINETLIFMDEYTG